MRIPARFAPIVFSALLTGIMVAIISAFVLVTSQGIHPGLFLQWCKSFASTWPIAFPTMVVIAPWVKKLVGRMTV